MSCDPMSCEIDFVIQKRGKAPAAIECKWSAGEFDTRNLLAFRQVHPQGDDYVVSADVQRPYRRSVSGQDVQFLGLDALIARLAGSSPSRGD